MEPDIDDEDIEPEVDPAELLSVVPVVELLSVEPLPVVPVVEPLSVVPAVELSPGATVADGAVVFELSGVVLVGPGGVEVGAGDMLPVSGA